MKILAVGMNYAEHNKELNHTLLLQNPVIFSKPDSALLSRGRPFFIPSFAERFDHEIEIVVKICHVGKNISERFAHRYYDEVTVGIDFTARDLQDQLTSKGLLPGNYVKDSTTLPLSESLSKKRLSLPFKN